MNSIDYIIIGAYLVGLLLLGYLCRGQAGRSDYFLGGRTIDWKPLALSVMATQLSAVSFISAPAFVGLRENGGMIWLSYEFALPLAMLFLMMTILPALYKSGVISIYDFLENRFGRSSRLLISLVFQVSRAFATGIMVYAISIILQGTLGVNYLVSILIIGAITLVYSLIGGMKAVVYGDALQMILIVLGTVLCLLFSLHAIGGIDTFWELVNKERLNTMNVNSFGLNGSDFGLWPMLFGGFVLYAAYYGCDQSEAQRSLSAHSLSDLKKIILSAALMRFPITLLYCASGLVIGTLAIHTPSFFSQIPAAHPDWMMPIFIINYLPNGIIGLLVVAILAAAMSSVSSAINSLSAVTTEDYCRVTQTQLSDKDYLLLARKMGIFWGVVTLVLSVFAGDIAPTVIEAINKIGSVFYGPVLASFLLALCTLPIGERQFNLALIGGVLVNIGLWLAAEQLFWFWWNVTGFSTTMIIALTLGYLAPHSDKDGALGFKHHIVPQKKEAYILIVWFCIIVTISLFIHRL